MSVGAPRVELGPDGPKPSILPLDHAPPRHFVPRRKLKTNFCFFSRRQPFISFSLLAAVILSENFSQYTNLTGILLFCKQVFILELCCLKRFLRLAVMPV